MQKYKLLICFLLLTVSTHVAFGKKDVEFSGRLNVEFQAKEAFRIAESEEEGVLQFKTKRYESTRAVLEMRGSTQSQNIFFREAFIDHKFKKSGDRIRIGRDKKRFGLEFERPMRDRIALVRGPIYRKMEAFAFVGRDLNFTYRWGDDEDYSKDHFRLAYHSAGGVAHGLIFHWRTGTEKFQYSQWTLLQASENGGQKVESAWGHISSIWWESNKWRGSAEIVLGKDPLETVFQKNLGNSKNILFAGAKAEFSVFIGKWEPILQANFIMHDMDRPSFQTFQGLGGFRYYFTERFRLGLNIEYLTSAATFGVTRFFEITDTQTNGLLTARFFF